MRTLSPIAAAVMSLLISLLVTCPPSIQAQSLAETTAASGSPVPEAASALVVGTGTQVINISELLGTSGLQVSAGATAVLDFSGGAALNLSGNIDNSGSIYVVSTNPAVTSANITAQNIFNNQGALLTSVLPTGGLAGFSNAIANLSMNLTAVNQIINAGTISSASNLALTAGAAITNQSVINAVHDINIASNIGSIVNSGLIASASGSINLSTTVTQNLLVNNTNGAMQALLGSINISNLSSVADKHFLRLLGGDVATGSLNLVCPDGIVSVDVGKLIGQVNISAGEAHVNAATENLVIGTMNLTGDPTYYNSAGNVLINFDLTAAAFPGVAIIAAGDIITGPGVGGINTSVAGVNAGAITLIAGALFSPPGTNDLPPGDTGTTLVISGASPTGGQIDLTGGGANPITSLSAEVTSGNGSGGVVTLVAFGGSNGTSGNITLPSSLTITTGTSENDVFATNGNVNIIGSGNISIGGINSSGNTVNPQANNGAVVVASAMPVFKDSNNNTVSQISVLNGGILSGANIVAGNTTGGSVTIAGDITAGANVTIASAAAVSLNGSIGLTQNPAVGTVILQPPSISLSAGTLTIEPNSTVSSQIAGQPNSLVVTSPNATVSTNATLSGNVVTMRTLNLLNNGTISGTGTNAFVDVQSNPGSGLTVAGTGTFSAPASSVIELAAADNQTLTLNGSLNYNTGAGSLLIMNAQGSSGLINVGAGALQQISGGPVVSINTPNLQLGNASSISATGTSVIAITNGYTANDLTITLGGTSSTISAVGGAIKMRPRDGQNLNIDALSAATLNLNAASVLLATAQGGNTSIGPNVTITPSTYTTALNPAGGINGIAFQPYVGGAAPASGSGFVLFGAYTYQQVLAMLAPIAAEQQFQVLSNYTQQYASGYVIQAAKQVGMRVSAGVFVTFNDNVPITDPTYGTYITSQPTTNSDIALALAGASTHGNVLDIVVGNEDIIGDSQPQNSIATLTNLISTVQNQRNNTLDPLSGGNFTSLTLPVTTRQIGGVYGDVSSTTVSPAANANMATLLNTVDGYVYGNFYPFLNSQVINGLSPGISQSDFQTLVYCNMSAQYLGTTANPGVANIVKNAGINTAIRIGETGWATQGVPQANTTWAQWYYGAMQSWSYSTVSPATGSPGVPISGYFESYNEPWKPLSNGAQEPYWGIWAANGTNPPNGSSYTLTSITQKYSLPLFTTPLNCNCPVASSAGGSIVAASLPMLSTPLMTASAPTLSAPPLGIESLILPRFSTSLVPILPTEENPEIKPNIGDVSLLDDEQTNGVSDSATGSASPNDSTPSNASPNYQGQISVMNQSGYLYNIGEGQTVAKLLSGDGLFAPDHNITVQTSMADIAIKSGAAVMIVQTGDAMSIFTLHDEQAGSVVVTIGDTVLEVPVGRQVVITTQSDSQFEDVNPSGVGYRELSIATVGGKKVFVSEFSLPSALAKISTLRQLLKSKRKEERALARRIIKTTAAITVMTKPNTSPFASNR